VEPARGTGTGGVRRRLEVKGGGGGSELDGWRLLPDHPVLVKISGSLILYRLKLSKSQS